MENKKITFNFFEDKDVILNTFANYLGVRACELKEFIENRKIPYWEYEFEDEIETIQSKFNIDLRNNEIDNVYITVKHITTTRDEFKSLKKYGLRDLQFVLEGDTYLNKFLYENGIVFDISNDKMFIDGDEYNIINSSSNEDIEKYMSLLHTKFNHDKCQIECFSESEKEELDYPTPIKDYPEILLSIENFLNSIDKSKGLNEKWKVNNDKYYVLEFDIAIKDLNNYKNKNINKVLIQRCYPKIKGNSRNIYEQIVNKEPIPYESIKIIPFDR